MAAAAHGFVRRLRYGEPIIVVSGLPRSGTSMAMKMLEAGGVELLIDGVRTADGDNPKGYFEYEPVKRLDKDDDPSWLKAARGKAVKIISYLLLHLPEDSNYRVLFMRRDLKEVVASQNKMLVNRDEPQGSADERMMEAFRGHLEKVDFVLSSRPQFARLDISHRDALGDAHREARRIAEFLERPLDVEKMAAVVDRALYRNRA